MIFVDKEYPSIFKYVIVSVALHLLILLFLPKVISVYDWKPEIIQVLPLVEKEGQYQLVDIMPPAKQERPDKAKYLGMYDSRVEEERVARGAVNSGKQLGGGKKQEKAATKVPASKKNIFGFDKRLFAENNNVENVANDKADTGAEASGEVAVLEDYLPDYKYGAHTYLNVLRFPEVEYFVRLKRSFKMTFNPMPSLQSEHSFLKVAGGKVETVMALSVNASGNIAELFILKSSGLAAYDGEAMRTIRASSPFAKPPQKFLDDDGLLRMSWTFIVYL